MSKIIIIFFSVTLILIGTWADTPYLFAQGNSYDNPELNPLLEDDSFIWLTGLVLSKTDGDTNLGLWTIQNDDNGSTMSVLVDGETEFLTENIPVIGQPVIVEGALDENNVVQAWQVDLVWVELEGILQTISEDPNGFWVLEDGQELLVDSAIRDSLDYMPAVGEQIAIEGYYINDSILSVTWIEYPEDFLFGTVTQRPEEDEIEGEWHIEIEIYDEEDNVEVIDKIFLVDEDTDFFIGIPEVGQRIYIEGSETETDVFYAQIVGIEYQWFSGTLMDSFEQDSMIWWEVESQEDGLLEIQIEPELIDYANLVEIGQQVDVEAILDPDGIWNATWLQANIDDAIDELIIYDEDSWDLLSFSGTTTVAPDDETGIGYWHIKTDDPESIKIWVGDTDVLIGGVPKVGQQVYVEGYLQEDGVIWVEILEPMEGEVQRLELDIQEFTGVIRKVPVRQISDSTQTWVVETDENRKIQIHANSGTTFYPSKPTLGEWVNIIGTYQTDGSFLAREIALDTFEVGEVVVHLASGVISQTIISRYNLNVESTMLAQRNAYIFTVPNPRGSYLESIVAQMQKDNDIEEAYLNYTLSIPVETVDANPYRIWYWSTNNASSQFNENTLTQINLDNAHDHFTGEGQIVAVLDTGVDPDHPAWKEGQIMPGLDLIDGDDSPDDDGTGIAQGHGTHISGIIAKIAPDSRILPVRVLNGQGRGDIFDLAYGIEWAAEQGADVINLSLGTTDFPPILWDTINYVVHEMDVIVVAAAGNSSSNKRHYPAAFANTLSVTAVDAEGKRADFANYGHWVEMAAPGTGITSTITGPNGDGYGRADGTSMAAPFVTGAAALLLEKTPDATQSVISDLLQKSRSSLNDLNPDYQDQLGSMLNVSEALGLFSTDVESDSHTEMQDTLSEKDASGTESPTTTHHLFLPIVNH